MKKINFLFLIVLITLLLTSFNNCNIQPAKSLEISSSFVLSHESFTYTNWSPYWKIGYFPINDTHKFISINFGCSVTINETNANEWTPLSIGWNTVTATINQKVSDVLVLYNGIIYNWRTASIRMKIVYRYIYYNGKPVKTLITPGLQYEIYAYKGCDVKI